MDAATDDDQGGGTHLETIRPNHVVESDTVRNSLVLSSETIFGKLTQKQKAALRTALDAGYYRKPRGANAADVAGIIGVPRTTFIDHIRKAENKALTSLQPYVSLIAK